MEKLGLIAPLCQASHFPVFDSLSTSLKYLTQSAKILSVATQVDLSFQCGASVGLFLPRSMACAFGLPAFDGNGCGQPLYLLIGASRKCACQSHTLTLACVILDDVVLIILETFAQECILLSSWIARFQTLLKNKAGVVSSVRYLRRHLRI